MFLKEGEEGRGETEKDMGSANEQGEHRSQVSVTFISHLSLLGIICVPWKSRWKTNRSTACFGETSFLLCLSKRLFGTWINFLFCFSTTCSVCISVLTDHIIIPKKYINHSPKIDLFFFFSAFISYFLSFASGCLGRFRLIVGPKCYVEELYSCLI